MPTRPQPFSAFTTPEFWADPHISARMLEVHLDPDVASASRDHPFIARSADWIIRQLDLRPGARVLDLGCGPGLYAHRLARAGIRVHGIDVSETALTYARSVADRENLTATFQRADYLRATLGHGYDAALLIYEDYCALSPDQRHRLLRSVHAAVRAGGSILFDVTAAPRFAQEHPSRTTAANLMDGFWAAEPYVGVHECWTYPDRLLVLDRYTITTATWVRQFWNWLDCLTPEEVTAELVSAGWGPSVVYGDVAGARFDPTSPTFAVIASR